MSSASLSPHPDRLLPAEPGVRAIARRIYESIAELPIISPHGHVDPQLLVDNLPFPNPATLFISPDHYTTRLMHAQGVDLAQLGVGRSDLTEAEARTAWKTFCSHWNVYSGTPVQYWFESELAGIFGIEQIPSAQTADAIYDVIAAKLLTDAFLPRALL